MAANEDLEKVLGGQRTEALHAQVLQDQQFDPTEFLDQLASLPGRFGLGEVLCQVEGAADQGR